LNVFRIVGVAGPGTVFVRVIGADVGRVAVRFL
jgi:hypothetical protein